MRLNNFYGIDSCFPQLNVVKSFLLCLFANCNYARSTILLLLMSNCNFARLWLSFQRKLVWRIVKCNRRLMKNSFWFWSLIKPFINLAFNIFYLFNFPKLYFYYFSIEFCTNVYIGNDGYEGVRTARSRTRSLKPIFHIRWLYLIKHNQIQSTISWHDKTLHNFS